MLRLSTVFLMLGLLFCAPLSAAQLLEVNITDPGKGQLKKIVARAYLEATPEQVWNTISRYERYPQFLPRVASTRIDRRSQNVTIATMKLDLPFPMNGTWYTNRYVENKAAGTIDWKMLRGSLKSTVGRWKISPQGKGTLVQYALQTDPGIPFIPQRLIQEGSKRTIPDILRAVEAYAQKQ
jgi:coenzyme Q-binding protein COQ10